MSTALVEVVICAHDNRSILDPCLDSVRRQSFTGWRCTVVDDASKDGTAEWLARSHPWVRVVRSERNLGPAHCRNLGMKGGASPFLAFLDSDVELERHWLERAVRTLESDPSAGIVGGKLLLGFEPRRLHAYGGTVSRIGIAWNLSEGEPRESVDERRDCLWTSSAAMLVRRSVIEALGGFDGSYFYGFEDTDLGWRATLAGHRVVCDPDLVARHGVSRTVSRLGDRVSYHASKNRLRSLLKNYGPWNLLRYLGPCLLYAVVDAIVRPPRRAKLAALVWNARMLADTLRERRIVQGARTVPDGKITRLFDPRYLTPRSLRVRRRELWTRPAALTSGAGFDRDELEAEGGKR